ncbi:MAG: methionine--tRNA ligase [Treponemataceae bacterium]
MNKRLITSALPYVNNIPHLGNLIQVLSADVFARFSRSRGYETLYVCGTDEYGTATETRALEEGKTPKELCDHYYAIHKSIYEWFEISFDHFGRTSCSQQTHIVQNMFLDLEKKGFITQETIEQLFCDSCDRFLADRYVRGLCPHCGSEDARGDQCESCGKLLEPTDLKSPRCSTCGCEPKAKSTTHLYIDLPAIQKEYAPWMEQTSIDGKWAKNAVQMTHAWIRDGLQKRAITRDLKWGIPVPKEGFENKVFYVWFDAPIGYISITKELSDISCGTDYEFDWKNWWLPQENDKKVELFQFIGKDNIPFHTVIFPSTLIGSGKNWTKLFHMSSSEYLNYEGGKFSKSKGVGVFGSDAKESGIPADMWRFYIFYNRPEKSDTQFVWKDFQEKLNSEFVGNLCNLVNRTTTFVSRYYDGIIPDGVADEALWSKIKAAEEKMTQYFEWADLKEAFHTVFEISSIANKAFQDGEPWKTKDTNPEKAASLIRDLCYVIKDLMIMVHPFVPFYAQKVMSFFDRTIVDNNITQKKNEDAFTWSDLGKTQGLEKIVYTEIIFKPLDVKKVDEYRTQYAGTQTERAEKKLKQKSPKKEHKMEKKKEEIKIDPIAVFNEKIALKVAKIIKIEKHADAEKLYVINLDDGSGIDRIIVSSLVPFYKEEELFEKSIIIVDNLKPRKMRGIESRGMLLAAEITDSEGNEICDVLECDWAKPGTPVILEGTDPAAVKAESLDAETFFSVPISCVNKVVKINEFNLVADGKQIMTKKIDNGSVG